VSAIDGIAKEPVVSSDRKFSDLSLEPAVVHFISTVGKKGRKLCVLRDVIIERVSERTGFRYLEWAPDFRENSQRVFEQV
jgi:hypothetical protein